MRVRRHFSFFSDLLSLLLVYSLLLSIIAPFTVRSVKAAPAANEKAGRSPGISTSLQKKGGKRDGELLIRFRKNATDADKSNLIRSKGGRRDKSLRGASRIEKIKLHQGKDVEALAAELRLDPSVEAVEPNYLVSKDESIPDAPRFSEQWALKNSGATGGQAGADIGAPVAWDTTTGSTSTIIAVIDSGIDFSHPDLKNNRWANQLESANNRDDDGDGFTDDLYGWDWVTDSGVIRDGQGHGTVVAGIIAAQGNNATGTSGVMWRASLMSLRVLDNIGMGDVAEAVEAIDYAVAHGAQVINCSWGTDEESTFLRDAIGRAGEKGVVVVTSAGNDGRDLEGAPYYPASFGLSNLISVAATNQFDSLASFSNYGSTHVTIAAPGTDILTTQMGGGYRSVSGTSASAPFVTGVAGLIKTLRPWLTAPGTRAAILDGARHVDALAGRISTGGVVSASGALNALRGPNNLPPDGSQPLPTPSPSGAGTGGTGIDGGFSVSPPTQTTGAPGTELPNLDEAQRTPNSVPKGPNLIRANLPCSDCDPSGGGGAGSGGSYYPPNDQMFATARTRPQNDVGDAGVDLGSRNLNWSLPLLGLKGRAGLDLSLTLYYNSLVWTKDGNYIKFNADQGNPSAGFHLGFPFIQQRYYNSEVGVFAYMMVLPSGARVEMRQVNNSNTYESADSSYVQMIDYTTEAHVRTKDGTRYIFYPINGELRCHYIIDRNGNYISVSYDTYGRVSTIMDTLARTITFNYGADQNLEKITQTWKRDGVSGQVTEEHVWARFYYGQVNIQPSFTNDLYVNGPNNSFITVLGAVVLDDGTYYGFDYNQWGQVWKISSCAADNHLRNYEAYNLPGSVYSPSITPQSDCPRFTERHDKADNWINNNEAVTTYSVAGDGSWSQETMPDGTIYKELYYTSGWQNGLPYQTEFWSGGVRKKWTTTAWTQDDPSLSYQLNPRPYDMSTYDEAGNRRRIDIIYTSYGLPHEVREYSADGSGFGGFLRRTYTDYKFDQVYIDNHVLGLVSAIHVVDENNQYLSKTTFDYDWDGDYWQAFPANPTLHDTGGDNTGRGNLCRTVRWDVTDINNFDKASLSYIHYNRAGLVVRQEDHYRHGVNISYTDSFSDGAYHLPTFAYPTTVTNDAGYSSTTQYNYDMGVVTRTQDPKGAAFSMQYDAAGRVERINNLFNGAYTRYVYLAYGSVQSFTLDQSVVERYHITEFDGAGRVRAEAENHSGSAGGYSVRYIAYDNMGRVSGVTNPTEINSSWQPTGDDSGWVYTLQSYDWKGRPLLTTNPDGTTRESSYSGCGCAGGEQVTTRDERGRRKRMTMDVMGRLKQVEELNWDTSVYSTTIYSYNARDQVTQINQAGLIRSFEYDGYGRLWHRITPEQGTTTYTYNMDDTVNVVTDARGASATYSYNNRHLVTGITYGIPAGVSATANVTLGYDEAGNRTSMTDAFGSVSYSYNTLSELTSETRTFNDIGSYTLSYSYDLGGQLLGISNSINSSLNVGYSYDHSTRVSDVTGAGYAYVSSYASNIRYRAWSGLKQVSYSNGRTLSLQYDNRLRLSRWDLPQLTGQDPTTQGFGYQYSYNNFSENTGRVTYAQNLYDPTLDRSYEYDQAGRISWAHTGSEARWHIGIEPYTVQDGPYSQYRSYDVYGNITYRVGWGGWFASWVEQQQQFAGNRLQTNPFTGAAMQYDASGNLTNDGYQSYQYDATGQQVTASMTGLTQWYDGDGLRCQKLENGQLMHYLRSSVLGGQVVAEIDGTGSFIRGYVYLGNQLLAIQSNQAVHWIHSEPVSKSQRITDSSGNVESSIEIDPFGGEVANRSANSALQPRKFTSYERDGNNGDEAMFRHYEGRWNRFSQPDPFDGSYDLTNPQSFNRYSYVQSDPVNFSDPSGLMIKNLWSYRYGAEKGWDSVASGFYGAGSFANRARGIIGDIDGNDDETVGGGFIKTRWEQNGLVTIRWSWWQDVENGITYGWYSETWNDAFNIRYPYMGLPRVRDVVRADIDRAKTQEPKEQKAPPCEHSTGGGSGDIAGVYSPFQVGLGYQAGVQLDANKAYPYGGVVFSASPIRLPAKTASIMAGPNGVTTGLNYTISVGGPIAITYSGKLDPTSIRSIGRSLSNGSISYGGMAPGVSVGVIYVRKRGITIPCL